MRRDIREQHNSKPVCELGMLTTACGAFHSEFFITTQPLTVSVLYIALADAF